MIKMTKAEVYHLQWTVVQTGMLVVFLFFLHKGLQYLQLLHTNNAGGHKIMLDSC